MDKAQIDFSGVLDYDGFSHSQNTTGQPAVKALDSLEQIRIWRSPREDPPMPHDSTIHSPRPHAAGDQGLNALFTVRNAGRSDGKWRRITVDMVLSATQSRPVWVYT